MIDLQQIAERVVQSTLDRGAQEASASMSRATHVNIVRREGRVEQATEATTRGLTVSLLKDDRYTSNSTSDLRPAALSEFIDRCVASASYLEPDPDRAQPAFEQCGRGSTDAHLDQDDASWHAWSPEDRLAQAVALEERLDARRQDDVMSSAVHLSDGRSEAAFVLSNGFKDTDVGTWFALGAELSLAEGDKRPEGTAFYAARHLSDLPSPESIASDADQRVRGRLGATVGESGNYVMILENRVAGRLLGTFGGALAGGALHHKRSFLEGRLGQKVGSPLFHLVDDPTIPRGLGSRPWFGGGIVARPRTIVNDGVLEQYNINVYYGRKLGMEPTGGRSNWILRPGEQSWQSLVAGIDKAILVTGFLGGNANSTTGDFSYGIRGHLVENGEITQPLAEMNVAGNAGNIFERLVGVGNDPWTWSSTRSPTLVFDDVVFSGS